MRILLAEDDMINRIVFVEFIKRLGYEFVAVENGTEVLKLLREEQFDMVLMDVRMPLLSGVDATHRIRNGLAGNPGIPIIALTAHAMKGDRERFIAEGMDEYLAKPVSMNEFGKALRKIELRLPLTSR